MASGDHAFLSRAPVVWAYGGVEYHLGVCDIDTELFFQSRHEAYAAQRLDAIRGQIGDASYRARMAAQQSSFDTNQFAFGGDVSFQYLLTDLGQAEYFALLMERGGGKKMGKMPLLALAKSEVEADKSAWETLWKAVMRRDFPTIFPPEKPAGEKEEGGIPSSPPMATPVPSTTASTSS